MNFEHYFFPKTNDISIFIIINHDVVISSFIAKYITFFSSLHPFHLSSQFLIRH
jgi:hypothetical protein